MKFKGFSIGFIAFALLACTAIANDSRHGLTYEKESQHLEQVREEMKSEFKKAKVKSRESFIAYLNHHPDKLPNFRSMFDIERDAFINSLHFTEHGLAGFYMMDIVRYMPAEEIQELLGLFNAQHHLPAVLKYSPFTKSVSSLSEGKFGGDSPAVSLYATWNDHQCTSRGCQANWGSVCNSTTCTGDRTCPYPLSCRGPGVTIPY
ncbi:MAG: hypothetical protein ACK4E7_04070 [Permianibacter sp.]